MIYYENGGNDQVLTGDDLKNGLNEALDKLGSRSKVLAIPPDFTRCHSQAGALTRYTWEYYGDSLKDVLPALGTHSPMTHQQIADMFGDMPEGLFREHDWRNEVVTLGEVPCEFINEVSEGKLDFSWPVQVNRMLVEGDHDLILSIGQVVPHEVVGMANHSKNILVGTGGSDGINRSHFLGAVYGMERMMGRADTPVRRVLDYAVDHFLNDVPIVYVQTVVAMGEGGVLEVKGLFIGDDRECFDKAADLSREVNFDVLEEPLHKVVVYLDPGEFKSTWLGNKSIYRTRMAMADGGELIVLAPGVMEFGEDAQIDRLIREFGYIGIQKVLACVKESKDLRENLGAAAHLIHGSSEGRFRVVYCPGKLSREEIEGVNLEYADVGEMLEKYDPSSMIDGFNELPDGEKVFYISNPAMGLWACRQRLGD